MWCEYVIVYMCDLIFLKNYVYIYWKIILMKNNERYISIKIYIKEEFNGWK